MSCHLCCSVMQCVAVFCNASVLFYVTFVAVCVAVCCSVLQCVMVHLRYFKSPLLQRVTVCCSVLQCVAVYLRLSMSLSVMHMYTQRNVCMYVNV